MPRILTAMYKPEPASDVSSPAQLLDYLRRELDKIENAFLRSLPREIDFLTSEPSKLKEGLTVGADGTHWNPGSGQGVYTYYAGAWHKLG